MADAAFPGEGSLPQFAAVRPSATARDATAPESAGSRLLSRSRADWRVMLGLTKRDRVLVLGGDSVQLGCRLAPWVHEVHGTGGGTASSPDPSEDAVLDPWVIERALWGLTAGSLDWVIVNGSMPVEGDLPAMVALLLPTLKPGGRVAVTFHNRWGLRGRLDVPRRSNGIDTDGVACSGVSDALRLMAAGGCSDLACYALLPNRREPRTMIPLEPPCPPAAEKFALDQTWKRASPGRALGRLALHRLVDMRVLRHLYPDYVVVGRKPC